MSHPDRTEQQLEQFLSQLAQLLSKSSPDSKEVRTLLEEAKNISSEWYELGLVAVELRRAAEAEGRTGEHGEGKKPASSAHNERERSTFLTATFLGIIAGIVVFAFLGLAAPDTSQQGLPGQVAEEVLQRMEKPLQKGVAKALDASESLSKLPAKVEEVIQGQLPTTLEQAIRKSSLGSLPEQTAVALAKQLQKNIPDAINHSDVLSRLPQSVAAEVAQMVRKEVSTSLDEKRLAERIAGILKSQVGKEVAEVILKSPFVAELPKEVAKEVESRLKNQILPGIRLAIADQFLREQRSFTQGPQPLRKVVFAPTGNRAISIALDGTAVLWDLTKGVRVATYSGAKYSVMSAAVSPDSSQSLLGILDGSILLVPSFGGVKSTEIPQLIGRHEGPVYCVAFSSDGRTAVSGGADRTLRVWDVLERREKGQLRGHQGTVLTVAFSPKDLFVVSGSADSTIRTWDIKSFREIGVYEGHRSGVLEVDYAMRGARIISISADGTAKLWDTESRRTVKTTDEKADGFTALAVSSHDGTFACGRRNDSVQLFEADAGKLLQSFPVAGGTPVGLRFVEKTNVLLSAGREGIITGINLKTGNSEPGSFFPLVQIRRLLP